MIRTLLRTLGYLIGAMALFEVCMAIVGMASVVLGLRLVGLGEMALALCIGVILGVLAAGLLRRSRPEPRAGVEQT